MSSILQLSPTSRADLLIASPKALQAIIAAVGDYYTWKLGQRVYGQGSNEAWAAVCRVYRTEFNHLQRLPDFADAICMVDVALLDGLQFLAVVLLHKNTFKLL